MVQNLKDLKKINRNEKWSIWYILFITMHPIFNFPQLWWNFWIACYWAIKSKPPIIVSEIPVIRGINKNKVTLVDPMEE